MKNIWLRTALESIGCLLAAFMVIYLFGQVFPRMATDWLNSLANEPVYARVPVGCAFVVHPRDDVPQNIFNDGPESHSNVAMRVTPFHAPQSARLVSLTPGDYPEFGYTVRIRNHQMWVISHEGLLDPNDMLACP